MTIIKDINRAKNINKLEKDKLVLLAVKVCYYRNEKKILDLGIYNKTRNYKYNRIKAIQRLKKMGVKSRNNDYSLYINGLSPGCIFCGMGRGLTLNFTDNCSRNCFYCYQLRPQPLNKRTLPFYIAEKEIRQIYKKGYLDSFAITGGEPLFVVEKACRAFSLTKKLTSNKCQTRLYTNGDFLTVPVFRDLRNSGLDEIRFGLNEYDIDFGKLARAKKYFPRVIIEMPVFPDEEERAKKILNEAEKIGIFGVNIKELNYSGHNVDIFKEKGYFLKTRQLNPYYFKIFDYQRLYPIYGSEETCFRLMEFALKSDFNISVHYCSINNKKDYSILRCRKMHLAYIKKPYETVAHNGLLKSLAVYFPEYTEAYKDLKRNNVSDEQIVVDKKQEKLITHPRNLRFLDNSKYTIAILYYTESYARGIIVNIKVLDRVKKRLKIPL